MNILERIKSKFIKEDTRSFYEIVGSEQGVYLLVKNFYHYMETEEYAKDCLEVHELVDGKVPDEVKKKLFMFLCGWFGGPQLFIEAYGHPRMRARHNHIRIEKKHGQQWLYCMYKAMDNHSHKFSKKNKTMIQNTFKALATRIVNA